jgi:hypothetical protein
MVILGLVAVGGYMWWKSRQDSTTEGTSSFSNASGAKQWCYCNGVYLGEYPLWKCNQKCKNQIKDKRA